MQAVLRYLERLTAGARGLVRTHWQRAIRIRQKMRLSEETIHLLLAGGVGVIGGLVNLCFHHLTTVMEALFFQLPGDATKLEGDYSAPVILQKLLIPAVGGLLAGLALYWGLRISGKQRSSNILEVVVTSDGRLPFRSSLVKAGSSLLSIGSGGSIGREGAITDLAAMLASKWGQLARWQPYRLRLLTACGAASGISAAYNAPLAGAIFSALIVLGNFSMNLFAPIVFSSVVAYMVSWGFFGQQPWYQVPAFHISSLAQLPAFLVLGMITGAMGAMFLKMLRNSQERFRGLPVPVYVRLALGGLLVGAIAIVYPGVWGNGYAVTSQLLKGEFLTREFPVLFLAGLFVAKLLATLATVGSGAVGGVFTPTLFLGAGLGSLWATLLYRLDIGPQMPLGESVAAFALVGMGGMLAATTRSPLLAMIMAFEISLNYSVMPPLMLACVVSTLVSRRLHAESIYTEPLRAKGLMLDRESLRPGTATEQTVGDLMRAPVPPLRETATLQEIAERFLASSNNFLPVVDAKHRLIGVVALQDLKEHLNPGAEMNAVIAYDVMRPPPATVTPNQLLLDTLPVMLTSEQRNVPVVNSRKENRLVGTVARAEVLGLLSEAIAIKSQPGGPPAELSLQQNGQNGEPAKQRGE